MAELTSNWNCDNCGEENRINDVYDDGYTSWIDKNQFSSDKIVKNTNINEKNFKELFEKEKSKNKSNEIITFNEPDVTISFKGKDSLVTLGQDKITDFSGESSGGLKFRDYKDAFSNSLLIDENSVDIKKRAKSIIEAKNDRKNISYKLSKEDEKKQNELMLNEEKSEQKRLERLKRIDEESFNKYNEIHKRMLGI